MNNVLNDVIVPVTMSYINIKPTNRNTYSVEKRPVFTKNA